MASPPKDPEHPELGGVDPAELQAYFVKSGRYTAGVATHYPPATVLTAEATHQASRQGLHDRHAVPLGARRAPRRRQAGAARSRRPRRWRLAALRVRRCERASGCARSPTFLAQSPRLARSAASRPTGADIDSVIDVRAVFQQGHRDLKVEELPSMLLPRKGRFGLIDYEKAFAPDLKNGPDIFDLRGIDREQGAIVVVRPDQYVANVLPLDAHDELAAFFGGFCSIVTKLACRLKRRVTAG